MLFCRWVDSYRKQARIIRNKETKRIEGNKESKEERRPVCERTGNKE